MEEILKCYVVKDDNEDDLSYGCIIVNRNTDFNAVKFQQRLDEEIAKTPSDEIENYDDIIRRVLDKYAYDYKNVSFILEESVFYI